jgi:hypothetical protein
MAQSITWWTLLACLANSDAAMMKNSETFDQRGVLRVSQFVW